MTDRTSGTDRLPALLADVERLAGEAAALAETAQNDGTGDLVPVEGSLPAEQVKAQLGAARADLARKRSQLKEAQERLKAEMDTRMRAAMAVLEPLNDQMRRLEEGIWTVNLYLGRDEEIVTLTEGKPADVDTPIHLRQRVLSMDEEVAAFPESGGMDFRNLDVFDTWITDPAHLAQVLPEERGVVVLRPRTKGRDYGDPWMNDALNKENYRAYWLIRNGENLYRMTTSFDTGATLMPTRSEFLQLFQERRFDPATNSYQLVDIEPGSAAWLKAEKAQDATRRHYMRAALILQGLIDRTAVLHPLPGAVSVLREEAYTDGLVVVIGDAEQQLTTGREPYYDWLRRLNAQLRPGMRILGSFHGSDWSATQLGENAWSGNARLWPTKAELPKAHEIYTLEGWKSVHVPYAGPVRGLAFKYDRTEKVWDPNLWVDSETRPGYGHRGGYKTPTKRATCVVLPDDKFVIPFDLVTLEEMQAYLDARTERHAYADSFPLLHAAIAAKRAEAAAEAPFRDLLAADLAAASGRALDEVTAAVGALVDWWKLSNKYHRPLVTTDDPATEAKAIRMIRGEYLRRLAADDGATAAGVVARLLETDPSIMWVGATAAGRYTAFAPQPRRHTGAAGATNLWVREYTLTSAAGTAKVRDWVVPGARAAKYQTLHQTEAWKSWDVAGSRRDDLTDDELDTLAAEARDLVVARLAAGQPSRHRNGTPETPVAAAPFAVTHDRRNKTLTVFALDTPTADPTGRAATLTGAGTGRVEFHRARLRWARDTRGQVSLTNAATVYAERRRELFHHDTLPWGKVHDGVSRDDQPVWVDDELFARFRDAVAVQKAAAAHRRRLKDRVHEGVFSVARQWKDEELERRRQRFIADYVDESLWADHAKSVRVAEPWHGSFRGPLETALEAMSAAGESWEGMTVGEVVAHTGGVYAAEDAAEFTHLRPAWAPLPDAEDDEGWD